jgi:hypothetical protein
VRLTTALIAALLLALTGCGGDDENGGGEPVAGEGAPARTAETPDDAPQPEEASEDDEQAIRDTIVGWLLEGGCERMTDKFLEEQAFIGDNRTERCDFFEKAFRKPQFTKDDIKLSDVEVKGDKATAVVGDNFSNVESKYTLVRAGEGWRIDSADLQ